jgi:hypothetical protein
MGISKMRVSTEIVDFRVVNQVTLFLLTPMAPEANAWVEENLPKDRMTWGSSVVVEHRYIRDIVEEIILQGMTVK